MTNVNIYQQKIVNNFFQNCGKSSNICVASHTHIGLCPFYKGL